MNETKVVYYDHLSSLEEIVAYTRDHPVNLTLEEVSLEEPGHAIPGENWAPQLAPYKPWEHDESLDNRAGTDGDLLIVGALGMGISDEEREALIKTALETQTATAHATSDDVAFEAWTRGEDTPHTREAFATNVPVSVRRDEYGYTLSAVHLSVLTEHNLPTEHLVVVVPASVDGLPVVRIASEAFSRRFTAGVQLRAIVVPDSVEVVGVHAFGAVSAEVIVLGAGVRSYDPAPLDMALPSPRLQTRKYVVDPRNTSFEVRDGFLIEKRNQRVLFAQAPYDSHIVLPDGIHVLGSSAFAKGCPAPRVIDTPHSFERVDGTVHPETIWRAANAQTMRSIVARCGGRVTDYEAVEQDDCWYGFTEAGAHLVAGPPAPDSPSRQFAVAAHARLTSQTEASPFDLAAHAANAMVAVAQSSDRLVLPREVCGRSLVALAERALITAPATLVIPETVQVIAEGNTCKGTHSLMLPEGLRTIGAHCFCSRTLTGPVLIPRSVKSVGEGSFEYAVVRLEAADVVVHITSDQLMSCFLTYDGLEEAGEQSTTNTTNTVPFDFARYDAQLLQGRGLPDHLGALLHRLASPYSLSGTMRGEIVEALRARANDVVAYVAREGESAVIRALAEGGFLDDETLFDRQIERLRASNRTEAVLYLMNWKQERQQAVRSDAVKSARERFAL